MNLNAAIKKLNKSGFEYVGKVNNLPTAAKEGCDKLITFNINGGGSGEIVCIRVRRFSDKDDSSQDYSAGIFVDNITQAIRYATTI